jgi:hypothetical protein
LFAELDGVTPPVDEFGCAHAVAISAAITTETTRAGVLPLGRRIQRRAGYRNVMELFLLGWGCSTVDVRQTWPDGRCRAT